MKSLETAIKALKEFNEENGSNCLGFCVYVHSYDTPFYTMTAYAPPNWPLYLNKCSPAPIVKNIGKNRYAASFLCKFNVVGFSQQRDVIPTYSWNADGTKTVDIEPGPTTCFIAIEGPKGVFEVEVPYETFEKYVHLDKDTDKWLVTPNEIQMSSR